MKISSIFVDKYNYLFIPLSTNKCRMNKEFSSDRLKTARMALGLSMEDLSMRVNRIVSRQSIHAYETNRMKPKAAVLEKLAQALGISPQYLEGKSLLLNIPALRSIGSSPLTPEEAKEMEEMIAFKAERYISLERKTGMMREFVNPLQSLTVADRENAETAAGILRERWQMGISSITSVCRLLERKGIKIIEAALPHKVLGLSTWCEEKYPLIIMNNDKELTTTERTRFTAVHELGHLLLNIPQKCDKERLCNQFAGCFLLPKELMYEEIGIKRDFITFEEAVDLHLEYGVSVSALIHQAWDLRIISREHYDYWFDNIISKNRSEEGWGSYPAHLENIIGKEKRMQAISEQINKMK